MNKKYIKSCPFFICSIKLQSILLHRGLIAWERSYNQ